MKKKILAVIISCFIGIGTTGANAQTVFADSATVVTIGADLSDVQEEMMFEYFGVDASRVSVLEVNNKEERQYIEGVASDAQIGNRTYSCAYIEPMGQGNGINVKIANLNWVTSYMVKTTLATAGIYDCNVVAAAPFEVSGTGALTGIMKAFETVTGTELEEEKKELATEELVITGNLSQVIGSDQAVGIITEVKDSIIGENIVVADKIEQVVIDASEHYEVSLTDEQVEMITSMMEKLAKQEYEYDRLQGTFQSIADSTAEKLGIAIDEAKESGFFEKIVEFFKNIIDWFVQLFSSKENDTEKPEVDLGILETTDDSILGDNVIIDATEESVVTKPEEKDPTTSEEPTQTMTPDSSKNPDPTINPENPAQATEEPTTKPVVTPTTQPGSLEQQTLSEELSEESQSDLNESDTIKDKNETPQP